MARPRPGQSRLLGRLLRLDPASLTLPGGDHGARPARPVLEAVPRSFAIGFNHVLDSDSAAQLHQRLGTVAPDLRGFAYEGAGMAAAILDILAPSRRAARVHGLLSGPGDGYVHLIHVGVGWAHARMRLRPWLGLRLADPLLRWLAWDGWGFHQGFFAADRTVLGRRVEPRLGNRRPLRDQGLGRSLWFYDCADTKAIAQRIATFPVARQGDLWSGIGLAASYAGGATEHGLRNLSELSGKFCGHVAQGAAFAAAARLRSGIVPQATRQATEILCRVPVETAAEWTETARRGLTGETVDSYQTWRSRIREICGDTIG